MRFLLFTLLVVACRSTAILEKQAFCPYFGIREYIQTVVDKYLPVQQNTLTETASRIATDVANQLAYNTVKDLWDGSSSGLFTANLGRILLKQKDVCVNKRLSGDSEDAAYTWHERPDQFQGAILSAIKATRNNVVCQAVCVDSYCNCQGFSRLGPA